MANFNIINILYTLRHYRTIKLILKEHIYTFIIIFFKYSTVYIIFI